MGKNDIKEGSYPSSKPCPYSLYLTWVSNVQVDVKSLKYIPKLLKYEEF